MRRIRKIAGILFAVALGGAIGWASQAEAASNQGKFFRPKRKPVAAESPRIKRDQSSLALRASLRKEGETSVEELEKLQQKIRLRLSDGYVRHMAAPASAYFPVEVDAYAPQTFRGPEFVQTAHKFIKANQGLICDPSSRLEFVTSKRREIEGRGYVRMQQYYEGVPVLAGSLIVQPRGTDGVPALFSDGVRDLSRLENGLLTTVPLITPEFARNAAIRATSADGRYAPDELAATEPVLALYEPGIFGLEGELQLVWDTKAHLRGRVGPVGERFLINARDGSIALRFNDVRSSLYRGVHDYLERPWDTVYTEPHPRKWFGGDHDTAPRGVGHCRRWDEELFCLNHQEGNSTHLNWPSDWNRDVYMPVPWSNIAIDYLAHTYYFYRFQHQRDSYGPWPDPFGEGPGPIQDHGIHRIWHNDDPYYPEPERVDNDPTMPYGYGYELMLTTRISDDNAFFQNLGADGDYDAQNLLHIAVGTRYQACDDVIAHEYTHGVTSLESDLFYMTESGAIDEALSDMWGEWIDLTNVPYGTIENPTQRGVRWVIGEDIDCPYNGASGHPSGYFRPEGTSEEWVIARAVALRDMRNPPYYGQPDKTTSPYFWTRLGDNGGVHMNSGIINKLAYLLSDGDTFNNRVVLGMGITGNYDSTGYSDDQFNPAPPGYYDGTEANPLPYYTYPKPPTSSRTAPELFYEVQCNLLNPASDFEDFYYALMQACDNLVMSETEKENVDKACEAVEIKPARISQAYNIVYKDKRNPALKPLIDDETNEIIIADPQAYGTLKITRNKNFPKHRLYDTPHGATIRVIKSAGSILNLYTEADVDDVEVDNELQSVTTKGCYIKRMRAAEVGTVRQTDYARSWSTGDEPYPDNPDYPWCNFATGEYYLTSIFSNEDWDPGRLKSGARPLKIQLNGLATLQVHAPAQSVTATISTKKWKVPVYRSNINTEELTVVGFVDDLSYAGTPADLFATPGEFIVGELKSYKLMGGSFLGQTMSSVARTPVVTRIKTSGMASMPVNYGGRYSIYYVSWIAPDLLDMAANKVYLESTGGGHVAPEEARAAGEFASIGGQAKRYHFGSVAMTSTTTSGTETTTVTVRRALTYNAGGSVGAFFSDGAPYDYISVFRSGTDPSSEYQNIVKVQASNYVRGDFQAGVEFDSDGNALAIRGDIKSILLGCGDDFTTSPFIMGHGWTVKRPRFRGDHSAFILHNLPYVPTDPH